ncbi:hypothetical protein ACHAXT_005438 [Thalassiosira profunda]
MRAAALLAVLSAVATARAFHQSAAPPHRRRRQSAGYRRPKDTPSTLRLAKRRVTPTKKSRQKKKVKSLEDLLALEDDLRSRGYRYIIGSDDSGGAGCLAGPVVAASCCVLKPFASFLHFPSQQSQSTLVEEPLVSSSEMEALGKVNDCKELTAELRRQIYNVVHSHPDVFAVSIAMRSPAEIDEMNLDRATKEAFAESIEALVEMHNLPFDELYSIVDGKVSPKLYASRRVQSNDGEPPLTVFPVRPFVNGDANVYTVALASIIARVARDDAMKELHEQHPAYGFDAHGGYGRKDHIETIHRLGGVDGVHRMSFKQVKGR